MSDKKETQAIKILHYMEKHGSITQYEALRACGCMRLGARIWDLRNAGYDIVSRMVLVHKADGEKAYVARYSLVPNEINEDIAEQNIQHESDKFDHDSRQPSVREYFGEADK